MFMSEQHCKDREDIFFSIYDSIDNFSYTFMLVRKVCMYVCMYLSIDMYVLFATLVSETLKVFQAEKAIFS